ncbi:HdeD family acid-resistance protein [Paucilactobacillus sp. N302-9]
MDFKDHRWGFDWNEFIMGILCLIAAYLIIRLPNVGLTGLVILFGVLALISGIATLAGYSKLKRDTGIRGTFALVMGIFDIIVAIFFLVDIPSGITTLGFLFAAWFLVDSLERLLVSSHLKFFGTGYFLFSVFLDILCLIIAFLLLINPFVSALSLNLLLAIYLVIFGINALVIAFARRN